MQLLKKYIEYIKIPSIVVGAVGAIIVSYKYFESIPNRSEKIMMEATKTITGRFDTIEKKIDNHTDLLNVQERMLNGVSSEQRVLKKIVTTEFAKTMTPQQVLNMMEEFEIKKNETGSYRTVPTHER